MLAHLNARRALALSFFVVAGCTLPATTELGGALGNGDFVYVCDSSTPTCDPGEVADPFPSAVAMGSTFHLRFLDNNQNTVSANLTPVSTQLLTGVDNAFTAVRAGAGGIVAENAAGKVIDFTDVRIEAPTAIRIGLVQSNVEVSIGTSTTPNVSTTNTTSLSLSSINNTSTVLPILQGTDSEDLAGAVTFQWTSTDSTIVSLTDAGSGRETITGLKTGTATVTVTGGAQTQTISVEVVQ